MGELQCPMRAYRASRPIRTGELCGARWSYLSAGGRGPVILLLAGALGQSEFSFPIAEALERQNRIIAPDYPPVRNLDGLTAGLCALLDAETVGRVHVVGGSFGGIVAQAFAWRHPERVASLVLSHAGAPRRIRGARVATGLLGLLPKRLLRALMKKRLRPVLDKADPFWAEQFDRSVARLGKADILSRVGLAAEFGARYGDLQLQVPDYPVLIVDADDDPLFAPPDQDKLHALYPAAERIRFTGTGHVAALLQPERLAAAIGDFVMRAEAARGAGAAR